ncbi:MAG: hypothetical protein NC388_01350 [Clostridium sp.]|nr:hypothetical protein [Clostridium sp.]
MRSIYAKGFLFLSVACLPAGIWAQSAMEEDEPVAEERELAVDPVEPETYRRSSLCLMLITDQGDQYAKAIEEQFHAMPLPARYNDLNVAVRVLNISKKKSFEKRVTEALEDRDLAKELVGKWFNRDYQGRMNMNRIHDWGGYNATYSDLKRAQSTERGLSLLTDEGEELLKNTFVLVCDIRYYDKRRTGEAFSALFAVAAGAMNAMAQQQAQKGNTANAELYSSISSLGVAGSALSQEIAGFSVNIQAYLYQLKWNDKLRDKMYGQYWVDETTPEDEARSRRAAFDSDKKSFQLEYLGKYRSRSSRTVSKSTNNLDLVIRQVCSDAVDKGINNLAKMYPVFKPKTPFTCDNGNIYAYIGTKEGVNLKSKYEVLETKKKKHGFEYKKVGTVVPVVDGIWKNTNLSITTDSLEEKHRGTQFRRKSGRRDICNQGLQLREMGKLGYQYKRHNLYVGAIVGSSSIPKDELIEEIEGSGKSRHAFGLSYDDNSVVGGFGVGWVINYHSRFSWNAVTWNMLGGGGFMELDLSTGFILRAKPWGKNGRWTWFVWPSLGYQFAYVSKPCSYNLNYSWSSDRVWSENQKVIYTGTAFHYDVKVGMNINEHLFVAANISKYYKAGTFGFLF